MSSHAKKLIEVALPLAEINDAAAREKSIRHGHPSTLHLWWARRPLAAARAVLFGQLVDDPSAYPDELAQDPQKIKAAEKALGRKIRDNTDLAIKEILVNQERDRLFEIIKQLVIWENTTKESVLEPAREEIRASWRRTCQREGKPLDTPLPPVLDPFAGGGAIPLEAQRLGMEAHASDLNPVAVLINKAMIEIPPRFADQPPVHPTARSEKGTSGWKGAAGLAEDVRRYGDWMREEAFKRIGHLYPPYTLTQELLDTRPDLVSAGYMEGDELTVIAWLWARTVPSPNPALNGKPVPLVSSFWLSKKKGKEAYVEPIVENGEYRFEVRVGKPPAEKRGKTDSGTKIGKGPGMSFRCMISDAVIPLDHVREKGKKGDLSTRLFAIVAEGKKGRIYLPCKNSHEEIAKGLSADVEFKPSGVLPKKHRNFQTPAYGLPSYGDLFTDRQLVALNTFCDLVSEAREKVIADAQAAQLPEDSRSLEQQGTGPTAYADAVAVYLGLATSRLPDRGSTICGWDNSRESTRNTFGRQAIPMSWDFAETNPMSTSTGNFSGMTQWVVKALENFPANLSANVQQLDASSRPIENGTVISTDPPYYDNIGYADLSDFFYVWLRRGLRNVDLPFFGTMLVPKAEELIAAPYRQGGKNEAEKFFLEGMTAVAERLSAHSSDTIPTAIYYAFKQAEKSEGGVVSTGWATFLDALIQAGFAIVGTWPMRTELANKIGAGANMLASSIVLVCRKREITAQTATRRDFIKALKHELPLALKDLQTGNISPVDLPQSSIGPGIGIFSRYQQVLEADGSPMSVRSALQLINAEVSEILEGQVAEMDDWTRFGVKWFTEYGFNSGPFGDANVLATAYDVAVSGVAESGILESGQNQVRIFTPAELPTDWDPDTDDRLTVWEVVHHLIRILESEGESAASKVLGRRSIQSNDLAENAKALAYRLFTICEERKWADLGKSYNGLVIAWPELEKLANDLENPTLTQADLI